MIIFKWSLLLDSFIRAFMKHKQEAMPSLFLLCILCINIYILIFIYYIYCSAVWDLLFHHNYLFLRYFFLTPALSSSAQGQVRERWIRSSEEEEGGDRYHSQWILHLRPSCHWMTPKGLRVRTACQYRAAVFQRFIKIEMSGERSFHSVCYLAKSR